VSSNYPSVAGPTGQAQDPTVCQDGPVQQGASGATAKEPFRVAFVPGVTPDKWVRRWRQRFPDQPLEVSLVDARHQTSVLFEERADMSLVRLPVERDGLHLIPLYREVPVVVVSKQHVVAAFERIHVHDLADEHHWDLAEVTAKQAVEAAAAGTGVVVLPMSVARLHHRKDVVAVPVDGVDDYQVGLAWRVAVEDARLEEFIGIVRGRTERSSRGLVPEEQARRKSRRR
jgi:DNA-binding transcriptional LysR family regulator